jgi:hypothetical protein
MSTPPQVNLNSCPNWRLKWSKSDPDVIVAGFGAFAAKAAQSATAIRRKSPKNARSLDAAASASPEGRAKFRPPASAMIAGPASDFLPARGLIVAGAAWCRRCAKSDLALLLARCFEPTQLTHAAIGRKEMRLGKAGQKPVTAL